MIAENEPIEEKPELEPADMKTLLCVCLNALNGIKIPQEMFDMTDTDAISFNREWDSETRTWNFYVPHKKPEGIVQPRKSLILPGDVN